MSDTHRSIPERTVPVLQQVEVVIAGGGFPGVCAAVAAARAGARVVLVERDGMLGGQAAEIYTFGLDGFFDNVGRQFVRGIPWEIIRQTLAEGRRIAGVVAQGDYGPFAVETSHWDRA